jgi:hypothetical protein
MRMPQRRHGNTNRYRRRLERGNTYVVPEGSCASMDHAVGAATGGLMLPPPGSADRKQHHVYDSVRMIPL